MLKKLLSIFKRKKEHSEKASTEFSGELSYLNDIPKLEVIGSVDLFETIGIKILDIRNEFYFNKIGGWMDYSQTFITLDNGLIICLPVTGSSHISVVKQSSEAKRIDEKFASKIIGEKIQDIFYEFFENEPDSSQPSYLVLGNGYALSEESIGMHGTGSANLILYTKEEFTQIIHDPEADRRSIFKIFNKEELRSR
jgi:hypothetical protein